MATRVQRLAEFTTSGEPDPDGACELLCEDHVGTYTLGFPCRRIEDGWGNSWTGDTVQAKVVGWRPWELSRRARLPKRPASSAVPGDKRNTTKDA